MRKKTILIFFVILLFVEECKSLNEDNSMEKNMNQDHCNMNYKIIQSNKETELMKFASWFHQDWKLLFFNFFQGAEMYLKMISLNEKKILKQELKEFLKKNEKLNSKKMKKAWYDLGAQAWQSDLDIHQTLNDFINLIKE